MRTRQTAEERSRSQEAFNRTGSGSFSSTTPYEGTMTRSETMRLRGYVLSAEGEWE